MAKTRAKNIEILQDKKGIHKVIYVPDKQNIAEFILSKHGTTTSNAKLIGSIAAAFETYSKDIPG